LERDASIGAVDASSTKDKVWVSDRNKSVSAEGEGSLLRSEPESREESRVFNIINSRDDRRGSEGRTISKDNREANFSSGLSVLGQEGGLVAVLSFRGISKVPRNGDIFLGEVVGSRQFKRHDSNSHTSSLFGTSSLASEERSSDIVRRNGHASKVSGIGEGSQSNDERSISEGVILFEPFISRVGSISVGLEVRNGAGNSQSLDINAIVVRRPLPPGNVSSSRVSSRNSQ